jgi:hypothetical protein
MPVRRIAMEAATDPGTMASINRHKGYAMTAARVLLVANRTAADPPLLEAVRRRARRGPAAFHLVIPATPQGLHRVVDPEVSGIEAAEERLRTALAALSDAAGQPITGHVGDANPLAAVADAVNLRGFDEIILSTLPSRLSRWMRIDLPRKVRALGLPMLQVSASDAEVELADVA